MHNLCVCRGGGMFVYVSVRVCASMQGFIQGGGGWDLPPPPPQNPQGCYCITYKQVYSRHSNRSNNIKILQ